MKKMCLVLCLVCGGLSAGENQRNRFFGIDGGMGLLDLKTNIYIATAMGNLAGSSIAPTLGYSFAISGGWQRYDYEKVGLRFTFGTRFDFGLDMGKFGGEEREKYKNANRYSWTLFYHAVEGLFDFVKTDEKHRFGMSLGLSMGINVSLLDFPHSDTKGGGVTLPFNGRIGFYTQIQNNVIELTASIPLFGFMGTGNSFIDSFSLNLGYKHLF